MDGLLLRLSRPCLYSTGAMEPKCIQHHRCIKVCQEQPGIAKAIASSPELRSQLRSLREKYESRSSSAASLKHCKHSKTHRTGALGQATMPSLYGKACMISSTNLRLTWLAATRTTSRRRVTTLGNAAANASKLSWPHLCHKSFVRWAVPANIAE